jgi:hypothetical protein
MRLPCRRTDFSSFLVFQLSTVAFGTSAFSLLNARVLRHSTLFSCILAVLNSPTIFLRKGFSFFQQALFNVTHPFNTIWEHVKSGSSPNCVESV